jgi:hypothetical protein
MLCIKELEMSSTLLSDWLKVAFVSLVHVFVISRHEEIGHFNMVV